MLPWTSCELTLKRTLFFVSLSLVNAMLIFLTFLVNFLLPCPTLGLTCTLSLRPIVVNLMRVGLMADCRFRQLDLDCNCLFHTYIIPYCWRMSRGIFIFFTFFAGSDVMPLLGLLRWDRGGGLHYLGVLPLHGGGLPRPPAPCLMLPLYYIYRQLQGVVNSNSQSFFIFVVSRWCVRTYDGRGRPQRPNPLRDKDLGQHLFVI